ncbi:MAG: type II toxin-antitoxin system death-on-curing family toxin [Nocardioidaceae bacterium]|nr:MAG: type II toxin-antitoxin system death-on-curing family toxin [Nocardioidaceae bacterium]
MNYLPLKQLLRVAERTLEAVEVRDIGLLESAVLRAQATVFGADAYPTLELKAAALTHSLAKNHALVDGNKRLALAGLIAFLGLNGRRLTLDNDSAYDFIIAIAAGELIEVEAIAECIAAATEAHGFDT